MDEKRMVTMNEMNKLIRLLVESKIQFEIRAIQTVDLTKPYDLQTGKYETEASIQVCSPSIKGCKIDAVCHSGSYGGGAGLLEVFNQEEDDVAGWLSAEEAFEFFKPKETGAQNGDEIGV